MRVVLLLVLSAACTVYGPTEEWEPGPPARDEDLPPPDTSWLKTVVMPEHVARPEAGVELEIATAVRDLSSQHFGRASGGARRLVAVGEPAVPYLGAAGARNPEIEQHIQIVLRPILRAAPARQVGTCLTSPYADVRIAASFICGEQQYTEHSAALVQLLEDKDVAVRRAAISALRTLSNRYFGYRAESTESQRQKAIVRWRELWR